MNIDLARRTLAAIETNPDGWYQDTWRCTSGMCFAGWAATLAGAEWLTSLDSTDDVLDINGWGTGPSTARAYVRYDGDDIPHDSDYTEIPGARHVRDYAAHVLGISDGQAEALFTGHNELTDLTRMVDALAADPAATFASLTDHDED